MNTLKSLLYASGFTAVSVTLLTLTRGMPTPTAGITVFVVLFLVMKFWGGDKKKD